MTSEESSDRFALRDRIENWAVWRDAGDWERFRTVWHDGGVMMAAWTQDTADEFTEMNRLGWEKGVSILHVLGGTSIDLSGSRAVTRTKMTVSQWAEVHAEPCAVVCTGRFYDFWGNREGSWGLCLRQPIHEKDRLDLVVPGATRPERIERIPRRLSPSCLPAILHGFPGKT